MDLDAEQQRAVQAPERLVRVIAGAGSGKTRVLTERVRWLIEECGVFPSDVCAITFTKKAAEELQRRLPITTSGAQVSTIHSLGYSLLRGSKRHRRVADESMRRRLVREALKAVTELTPREERIRLPSAAEATAMIGHAKCHGHPFEERVRATALRYQELLREHGLYDFDDLVGEPQSMFEHYPETQRQWAGRWSNLLIDEVQDTSALQWSLLGQLTTERTAVFVVGDAQQSIYKFRGANPGLMLHELDALFGGTFTDYPLSTNYRSVGSIVKTANRVSFGMPGALTLTEFRGQADGPVIYGLPSLRRTHDTADLVATLLKAEHEERGVPYSDMAVLYRVNANSEALESGCSHVGVPYFVVGGMGFYGRAEVKDVLAYLRLSQGYDEDAFLRVYNKPTRYLGKVWLAEFQRGGGWPVFATGRMTFSKRYMDARGQELMEAILDLQDRSDGAPETVVQFIRERLGYEAWLVGEGDDGPDLIDESKIENLNALQEGARRWDTVPEFLAFAGMCQRTAAQPEGDMLAVVDRVSLSTVHRAKGLEWPVVVVHGLQRDVFPHKRGDADEERRILYVAVTRAKDRLYFSTMEDPSSFYAELTTLSDVAVPAPAGMPVHQSAGAGGGERAGDSAAHPAVGGGVSVE